MNEQDLKTEIEKTYHELLEQRKVVAKAQKVEAELDSQLTDLNTALKVLRGLKPSEQNA